MGGSLEQRWPLSPPTAPGVLQLPVVSDNPPGCAAIPPLFSSPDGGFLANVRVIMRVGAGLPAVPSPGLEQDRWLFPGLTAFGGLKVRRKFCGFFPKGFKLTPEVSL